MEWFIKSLSRQCAVTNQPFTDGDSVVCIVVRLKNGTVERFDVLKDNLPSFRIEGEILGQWTRKISEKKGDSQSELQETANQEEFFLSLYEGENTSDKEVLKQLFSLLLEKKRILRFLGVSTSGYQKFLHLRSRKEFLVPIKEISPEDFISVENIF